ncbi:MAG: basic secretory family protein [Prevotellaceae bacterium]|jgi:hypothetical protein|nr:basic secretory family protein [Prevotellaceae bacterium]
MRKKLSFVIIASLFAAIACNCAYCQQRDGRSRASRGKIDTLVRDGYKLIFINRDSSFSLTTKNRMIETFFAVYPPMVERFNKNSSRQVNFIIDPSFEGVAIASGRRITYNPKWFASNPDDIDVVTHEVMHVVQAYGNTPGPGWLTEGIADYARYKYGVDNQLGGWSLPEYNVKQSYTDSYRITARFLLWIEVNKGASVLEKLDAAMRDHTYNEEIWKKLTGKSIDELWKEYSKSPELIAETLRKSSRKISLYSWMLD